jgi:hypothetical protein
MYVQTPNLLQQKEFVRERKKWQFYPGSEQSECFENKVFKSNRCYDVSCAIFKKLIGCLRETVGIS